MKLKIISFEQLKEFKITQINDLTDSKGFYYLKVDNKSLATQLLEEKI